MKKLISFTLILFLLTGAIKAQWETSAPYSTNPYDTVGLYHNQGIISAVTGGTGTWIDRAVAYSQSMHPGMMITDSLYSLANAASNAALYDSSSYTASHLSSTAQEYALDIISKLDNIETSSEIDGIIDEIKDLEDELLASDVSANEKKAVLSAASVARYSIYYWLENIDSSGDGNPIAVNNSGYLPESGPNGDGINNKYAFVNGESENLNVNSENTQVMPKAGWLRRLLRIAVGDAVGAIVGAGIGSLVPLCGPCIAGGAMLGALSGSLAAADSLGML